MDSAKDHPPAASSFKREISPAVRKTLVEYWGSEEIIDRPEIIAELGALGVSRINRIGRKSLHGIARALDSSWFIDSSRIWLEKEKRHPAETRQNSRQTKKRRLHLQPPLKIITEK
jgi:hypothetical protein